MRNRCDTARDPGRSRKLSAVDHDDADGWADRARLGGHAQRAHHWHCDRQRQGETLRSRPAR